MESLNLPGWLTTLLLISATALGLAALMGVWVLARVRRLRLPPEATFVEAMRLTPFSVVLFLDLLDLGLDFLGAPIAWMVLGRLGLSQLRGATVLESLIPITQPIPTMTLAWILVRLFGPKLEEIPFLQQAIDRGTPRRLEDIPKRYR